MGTSDRTHDPLGIGPRLHDLDTLLRENARLRQLLQEYGRHTEGCSAAHGDQYRCRCGWREVEGEFLAPAEEATQAGQR